MRKILQTIFISVFLCLFAVTASAQKQNIGEKTLDVSKRTAVIVVGKSAKYTYQAAKFTTNKIGKPIIVKSAPVIGKFVLKQTGNVLKRSYPIGKKLFIKYIKYKFMP